jgi:hypothetical protein
VIRVPASKGASIAFPLLPILDAPPSLYCLFMRQKLGFPQVAKGGHAQGAPCAMHSARAGRPEGLWSICAMLLAIPPAALTPSCARERLHTAVRWCLFEKHVNVWVCV